MLLTINDLLVFIVAQIHQSHVFNVDRRLWLQQMAEGPPSIMQPFSRSKVHGIKLYKKTRSANKKTYSCGAVVKATIKGESTCVDCYGELEEVLKVEYLMSLVDNLLELRTMRPSKLLSWNLPLIC